MQKNTLPGEKHFTVSIWILNQTLPRKAVLIHHKKLDSWMQPGGHIEKFENPIQAAIRETKEETGIDIGFLEETISPIDTAVSFLPLPAFFEEQKIPAHGNKPEHFHIDLMYVVRINEQDVVKNHETHAVQWFTWEEAKNLSMFESTKVVLQRLLIEDATQ